ncbi:hypothetical protein ACWGID_36345 [Kribbella sp. NPDC054772]
MTGGEGSVSRAVLRALEPEGDHRDLARVLLRAGWTRCGAGDWAVAYRSPDGRVAARISPFDPAGPYTAALYREAAHTRQVPRLLAHRRLAGGGDLQLLEWLEPVAPDQAARFHRTLADRAPELAELADVVRRVYERGQLELPWFAPRLDDNPDNIMRTADGRLVAADLFSADGPRLYAAVVDDPDLVVARIPERERRFITEIPLTNTGPLGARGPASNAYRPSGRRRPGPLTAVRYVGSDPDWRVLGPVPGCNAPPGKQPTSRQTSGTDRVAWSAGSGGLGEFLGGWVYQEGGAARGADPFRRLVDLVVRGLEAFERHDRGAEGAVLVGVGGLDRCGAVAILAQGTSHDDGHLRCDS